MIRVPRRGVIATAIIGLFAALTTLTPVVTLGPIAATSPGSPGIPQPGTLLYREDFQNAAVDGAVRLIDYANTTGVTYSASAIYANPAVCNGLIFGFQATNTALAAQSFCGASTSWWPIARAIPYAMGDYRGLAAPETNLGLAEQTLTAPSGYAGTMIEATGIPIGAADRFVVFSIDVANLCNPNAQALDNFFLLDGASVIPLNSSPYAICNDPDREVFTVGAQTVSVSTFVGDEPALVTGSTIGFRVANAQGSGSGNDQTLDEFRILDVTPQLDKSFTPAVARVGDDAVLTFTVTNTDELAEKSGWSFVDNLPSGIEVGSGAIAGSCLTSGADVAVSGTTIAVTGGVLEQGDASCTIVVPVVATASGTHTNCPDTNVTDLVGLNPPACATFDVASQPSIVVVKELGAGGRLDSSDQFSVDVSDSSGRLGGVETTGTVASAASATIPLSVGVEATITDSMAVGSSSDIERYTRDITCIEHGSGDPVVVSGEPGAWSLVPAAGVDYECVVTNTVRDADLVVTKAVEGVSDGAAIAAGTAVEYVLTFRNDGGMPAAVDVTDDLHGIVDDADVGTPAGGSSLSIGGVVGEAFRISGTVPGGESYEVRYSAHIRPEGQRGDDLLLNFLLPTGASAPSACAPGDALCTSNPIAAATTSTALGFTGGSAPGWAGLATVVLLGLGGVFLAIRRVRTRG